jgi:hypothetical protein
MATGDQYLNLRGWTITEWTPHGEITDRGIPPNAFPPGGMLLVGANPDRSTGLFNLHWLNDTNSLCTISGLKYNDSDGTLSGFITVSFAGQEVTCQAVVSLTGEDRQRTITGNLNVSNGGGNDTTAGTFKAQANPEPPLPYGGTAAQGR